MCSVIPTPSAPLRTGSARNLALQEETLEASNQSIANTQSDDWRFSSPGVYPPWAGERACPPQEGACCKDGYLAKRSA